MGKTLELQFNIKLIDLVAFALFAGDTLKVRHLGCDNGRAYKANIIDLGYVAARLIVLYKDLYVLHILEFDVAQIDGIAALQLLLAQAASCPKYIYKLTFPIS